MSIGQVAESHPHVANNRPRYRYGKSDPKNGVRDGERKQIAIAKKYETSDEAPGNGRNGQNRIGEMSQCEQAGRREGGRPWFRHYLYEPQQEKTLQQKLLDKRP